MQVTEKYFKNILADLIDENAIACRGILQISKVEFGTEFPTLAISLSDEPRLHVNLDFCSRHCKTEEHLKALVIHEFLHVLLGHTEKFKRMTPALNLALDAVINAIIHRTLGSSYSDMMGNYYKDSNGLTRLLRPLSENEALQAKLGFYEGLSAEREFLILWTGLYDGKLVADDLLDIADQVRDELADSRIDGGNLFLGNHEESPAPVELSRETEEKLRETLASMNGGGIWRNPRDHGVGSRIISTDFKTKSVETRCWEKTAVRALKMCITPDRNSKRMTTVECRVPLPVLNEGDRRGFMRSFWSPLLPEIRWSSRRRQPDGTTQIYLDVSGSMNEEMEALVALLWKLRRYIRTPFWAFSDKVEPAVIRNGKLETNTTGGTAMNCVLEHIAETRPGRAVVITDGYIERCDRSLLKRVADQQVRCIVSRDGSSAELERARIPYVQLGRFYND